MERDDDDRKSKGTGVVGDDVGDGGDGGGGGGGGGGGETEAEAVLLVVQRRRERIKNELVRLRKEQGVALWKPPYYGTRRSNEALRDLALSMVAAAAAATTATVAKGDGKNSNTNKAAAYADADDDDDDEVSRVLSDLSYFRDRALDKMRSKGQLLERVEIRLLGFFDLSGRGGDDLPAKDDDDDGTTTTGDGGKRPPQEKDGATAAGTAAAESTGGGSTVTATAAAAARRRRLGGSGGVVVVDEDDWAEQVEFRPATERIVMERVNPDLTASDLSRQLRSYLSSSSPRGGGGGGGGSGCSVRFVYRGKTLSLEEPSGTGTGTTLASQILAGSGAGGGGSDGGGASAKLLCLATTPANDNGISRSDGRRRSTPQQQQLDDDDQELIESIRTAAGNLRSADSVLEITDADGKLVSMSQDERTAFVSALGLHAMGKERMTTTTTDTSANTLPTETTADAPSNGSLCDPASACRRDSWQSALVFLLEADAEWNRIDPSWRKRVDNYALLQFDICWLYLQIGEDALQQLPDIVERLDAAERVLRQTVKNKNFVTLALVNAEADDPERNPVPPLAALFVRLFLLQGVALHYSAIAANDEDTEKKSKERLESAWLLYRSLRAVSPPDAVQLLCEANVGITSQEAVVALRSAGGNRDRADNWIREDILKKEQAAVERNKQRQYGFCANGKDYVDLNVVRELETVLDLPTATEDDAETSEDIASGLARLSNNNLERAIDMYQECFRNPATVLQRVTELDSNQGVIARRHRNRKRRHHDRSENDDKPGVDDIALATLMSMGVAERDAKRSLSSNDNQVEQALLWLSVESNANAPGTDVSIGDRQEQGPQAAVAGQVPNNDFSSLPPIGVSHDTETVPSPAEVPAVGSNSNESGVDGSAGAARRVTESRQELIEREAVELLERVLGDVLQNQHGEYGNDKDSLLGSTLDDEWNYIQRYRRTE